MATQKEQEEIIRKNEVQHSFWRFFVIHREEISDNTANEKFLREYLDIGNLPISYDNLELVWVTLTDVDKKKFTPANGSAVRKPRVEGEVKTADDILEALDEGIPRVKGEMYGTADQAAGVLPARWTKKAILAADRETLRKLTSQFGSQAINDRINTEVATKSCRPCREVGRPCKHC